MKKAWVCILLCSLLLIAGLPAFAFADDYTAVTAVSIVIPGNEYRVIEGMHGKFNAETENTLLFRSNGDFAKFVGLMVDGKTLDPVYYRAWSGSTYAELTQDCLAGLSDGNHILTFVFTDGSYDTDFTVIRPKEEEPARPGDDDGADAEHPSDSGNTGRDPSRPGLPDGGESGPSTGDDSTIMLFLLCTLVSGLLLLILIVRFRGEKEGNL